MPAYDPGKWIDQLMTCTHLPEAEMKLLCEHVRALLMEESNIQPVSTPVTICGDIHGQFWDLLELLRRGRTCARYELHLHGRLCGPWPLQSGDGIFATSHEGPVSGSCNITAGQPRKQTDYPGVRLLWCTDECQQKYGSATVWKACCSVFDYLNIAAIIDGETLCVHGGLSPDIRTLDQIRVLSRAQEIPHEGAFCDLMWSDPDDVDNWAVSPRGAGWLFGGSLVNEGYKHMFDEELVTVWSAPNYCYRCGNMAAILTITEAGESQFTVYGAAEENERDKGMQTRRMNTVPYFV
ncbi:Serine/threonine-protein phosphatase [Mycena kentingensis (nom. inval.)]|nr:Serine/threonine-protein phosphatase [Mycena kentingensis (nom. inval.)]